MTKAFANGRGSNAPHRHRCVFRRSGLASDCEVENCIPLEQVVLVVQKGAAARDDLDPSGERDYLVGAQVDGRAVIA